jgi:hypothetical protein
MSLQNHHSPSPVKQDCTVMRHIVSHPVFFLEWNAGGFASALWAALGIEEEL